MNIDLKIYKNIAILNFRAIGDMICAMPLLKYCRIEAAPGAKITLILQQSNASLSPFLTDANQIIVLPGKKNSYAAFIQYGLKLRNMFDLVICVNNPKKAVNFFIWLLHPKNSIAYVKNNWYGRLIKTPLQFDSARRKSRHCAVETLNLLLPCDSVPANLLPQITINENMRLRYQNTLAALKQLDKPLIAVSVSNTKDFCNLTPDNFAYILNSLAQNFRFGVVILFQEKDRDRANLLSYRLKSKNMALETPSLAEFITVLETADLCFSGEGGVGHMAAALNKPQVVLSGKTPLIEWAPLSSKAIILEHPTNVNQIDKSDILTALGSILRGYSQ